MNGSTALARVLVDELVRCGVREVVLCPGSRSAPLAYAVLAAERAGQLRLHVRVDERSAGFLALGLARAGRRPATVITTSGTAAANLHPAVLEAHHGAVPLIVLTADRPAELRGTGANQTTVQPGMYAAAVRWQVDIPAPGAPEAEQASWRSAVCRAGAGAVAALGGTPGPVHLNVAFRDPLVPDLAQPAEPLPVELAGRPGGSPWVRLSAPEEAETSGRTALDLGPRTLMVLGDLPDPGSTDEALRLALRAGWPVVAEPFGAGDRRGVLPHGPLLLSATDWVHRHLPERVLLVGRVTLSRDVARLLRHPQVRVEQVTAAADWADPGHVVQMLHRWPALRRATATAGGGEEHVRWAASWVQAGMDLARAVRPVLRDSWPSGVALAAAVLATLQPEDTLVLGSSNTARDVDLAATWRGEGGPSRLTVLANRGLAGIDGTVSTAVGAALAAESRTVALMGDLTFLHDANGLLLGPQEPRPDLTIVVANDDGGGIFATLEHGDPEHADDFERIFGTPTGSDLAALCRAHGIPHTRVHRAEDLRAGLTGTDHPGIRVVEVPIDRSGHRALRQRLARTAAATLR